MTSFDATVVWVAIVVLSLGTYALRASFLLGNTLLTGLPDRMRETLDVVPVAVLAALVAPELTLSGDALVLGPGNERFLAGVLAIGVAWKTENMLLTVGVGMGALWALQWAW